MIRSAAKIAETMGRYSDRRWYFPALALLAAFDLFVAVIPTDALVVSSVLLRPKRWVAAFLWVSAGSTVGAASLSGLVHAYGPSVVETLMHGAMASPTWLKIKEFLDQYGAPGLSFISAGPAPQQPAVVLCALAKMPLPLIAFSVWVGRAGKYGILAYLATHAPKLLAKIPGFSEFKVPKKKAK